VIPGAIPVFSAILLQNYFKSLPNEIFESGYIDGAGHWRILFQLILPLSLPVLSVSGAILRVQPYGTPGSTVCCI
jgi:putative aldouronate transport system permease protein